MATTHSVGTRGWFQYDNSEANIAEIGTFGWFDQISTDIFRDSASFSSPSTTSKSAQSGLTRSISFNSKRTSNIDSSSKVI